MDGVYASFLLARHLAVTASEQYEKVAEQLDQYWRRLDVDGPHIEMLLHEWRRIWRHLGPDALQFMLPFGYQAGATQAVEAERAISFDLDYYLSNPEQYVPPSHELMIDRIEMASPGGFSLRGIGEPIHELRELIKDLCYRNRQERERGELEIIKQKIALVTRLNLPTGPSQVLVLAVSEDIQEIKRLVETGNLALPGEEPPPPPKQSTTRRRKPLRKPRPADGDR